METLDNVGGVWMPPYPLREAQESKVVVLMDDEMLRHLRFLRFDQMGQRGAGDCPLFATAGLTNLEEIQLVL